MANRCVADRFFLSPPPTPPQVSKIRNVQQIKLEEVTQCVQEQEAKFHKEKKKTINRNRKMSLSLNVAKKKALRSMATKQFGFASKKNAIDIQLAPLEDVFYKIKVRTGLVHLDAAAIAELYIGQNDATTILRNECSEAMIEASGLKDKLEDKKDQLLKLQTMTKETNQHKSFYQELDIVEKDLHDRRHANEIFLDKAKKAKLNVSYICNVSERGAKNTRVFWNIECLLILLNLIVFMYFSFLFHL